MKGHSLRLLALCSVPLVGACAEEGDVGLEGPAVEIEVAPLTLPGITAACYDIKVWNGPNATGQTVWTKGQPGHQTTPNTGAADVPYANDPDAVCSSTFGNGGGGDIAYVGPCDADGQEDGYPTTGDAAGEKTNSITVWFDGLYDAGGYINPTGPNGWQNPCPNGCTLNLLCEENADNLATFNFTVMRDAQQGFFDIAVNFKDIFCSGKYDTCYDETNSATAIKLLFGDDEIRDDTGVLAVACTGGQDSGTDIQTLLSFSQVTVQCTDGTTSYTFTPDLSAGAGQHDVPSVPVGHTMEYAIYNDTEDLACPPGSTAGSCNKVFLNVAFNLGDLAGLNCHLSAMATAESSDDPVLTGGVLTAANSTHPFINVGIKDMKACQENPLNGGVGSGVNTMYASNFVGGANALPMCWRYKSGDRAEAVANSRAVDTYNSFVNAKYETSRTDLWARKAMFAQMANCTGTLDTTVRNLTEYSYIALAASLPINTVIKLRARDTVKAFVSAQPEIASHTYLEVYGESVTKMESALYGSYTLDQTFDAADGAALDLVYTATSALGVEDKLYFVTDFRSTDVDLINKLKTLPAAGVDIILDEQ